MPEQNAQAATATSASQSQADGTNTSASSQQSQLAAQASAADDASQADDASAATSASSMTVEEMARELAKVRQEAAANRVARRELEKLQRAQMSKEEQLAADLAASQKERDTLIAQHRATTLAYETKLLATELGLIDPEAAIKLLDASAIEYDEQTGAPKNLKKLMRELIAAKSYLVAQNAANGQQAPALRQPSSASATNSANGSNRTLTFTESQIAALSYEDYQKHRAAIWQAQREGRIRPG